MAPRLRDYRTRHDQGDGTYKEISHQGLISKANKMASDAAGMIGSKVGQLAGSAVPVLGNMIGGAIGRITGKGIYNAAKIALAYMFGQLIFSFIIVVVVAVIVLIFGAFTLFVINSGGYIVPAGTGVGFGSGTSDVASGSCPLAGNVRVSTSSYNPANETGHGGNVYWDAIESPDTPRCSFVIPTTGIYPGCSGPSSVVSGASDNYCANEPNTCAYYGYAADVVSGDNRVYLPSVCEAGTQNCDDMQWTADSLSSSSGGGTGVRFSSSGNGHQWTLVLLHLDPIGVNLGQIYPSGTQIGILTDMESNTHLHIELAMDGVPIRPDFLCGGGSSTAGPGSTGPLPNGWIITIPQDQLSNIVSSSPIDYTQNSCAWAGNRSLTYAVNANFFTNGLPDGPAGYDNNFTYHLSGHQNTEFYTFVISDSTNASIIGPYTPGEVPPQLANLNQYRVVVTGVSEDSWREPMNLVSRTVIGLDDEDNVYIGVFRSASVPGALSALREAGATQAFHLDGGGSTTLCQGGQTLFGGSRNVGNSIGTFVGDIMEITNN